MMTFNKRKSQQGSSLLGAIMAISLLSILGASLADLSISSNEARSNQQTYDEAFSVAQAGLEYALRKVYAGQDPNVAEPGLSFGRGSFISSKYGDVVSVSGRVGDSTVQHSIVTPTESECFKIDMGPAFLSNAGTRIVGVQVLKQCLGTVSVTQAKLTWVDAGGDDDGGDDDDVPNDGTVCHIPPGNPANAHTIHVGLPAVKAHLKHGDYLGPCSGDADDNAGSLPERLIKLRLDSQTLYTDGVGAPSGTLIDVTDFVVSDFSTHDFTKIDFITPITSPMNLTMELTLSDQTIEVAQRLFSPSDINNDYNSCDDDDEDLTLICHHPPDDEPYTICVHEQAVSDLLEHGDTTGACEEES